MHVTFSIWFQSSNGSMYSYMHTYGFHTNYNNIEFYALLVMCNRKCFSSGFYPFVELIALGCVVLKLLHSFAYATLVSTIVQAGRNNENKSNGKSIFRD